MRIAERLPRQDAAQHHLLAVAVDGPEGHAVGALHLLGSRVEVDGLDAPAHALPSHVLNVCVYV